MKPFLLSAFFLPEYSVGHVSQLVSSSNICDPITLPVGVSEQSLWILTALKPATHRYDSFGWPPAISQVLSRVLSGWCTGSRCGRATTTASVLFPSENCGSFEISLLGHLLGNRERGTASGQFSSPLEPAGNMTTFSVSVLTFRPCYLLRDQATSFKRFVFLWRQRFVFLWRIYYEMEATRSKVKKLKKLQKAMAHSSPHTSPVKGFEFSNTVARSAILSMDSDNNFDQREYDFLVARMGGVGLGDDVVALGHGGGGVQAAQGGGQAANNGVVGQAAQT